MFSVEGVSAAPAIASKSPKRTTAKHNTAVHKISMHCHPRTRPVNIEALTWARVFMINPQSDRQVIVVEEVEVDDTGILWQTVCLHEYARTRTFW
jgi:hypothetical protein